jgi:hypothetical protein
LRYTYLQRIGLVILPVVLFVYSVGLIGAVAPPHIGYGFNVAYPDSPRVAAIGFDWIKTFDDPPCPNRLPVKVLVRIDVDGHTDLIAWRNSVRALAQSRLGCVEAFEIGNEPNLDTNYGWAVAPNAGDYTAALCAAYEEIKSVSSSSKVISAGLAPTGRVVGAWNGHPGHNGSYQDEREFLKEMLAAGAGNCLDAVGYHPYGFSADYDAEPDVYSPDPARKCVNGFCFRGVEKVYEIMQAQGLGSKQVWATEWGWITDPPAHCRNLPEWQERLWQVVSEQKQADNLRGAFEYADAHWPWMGGMFVFNLDFNMADWYDECEQMRYYAVANRPAETVLTGMPKRPVRMTAKLDVQVESIGALIAAADQPLTRTVAVAIGNSGSVTMTWSAQSDGSAALIPTLTPMSGTLAPEESQVMSVTWTSGVRPAGVYTGAIVLGALPADTINAPAVIPITLVVAERVYENTLPLITK